MLVAMRMSRVAAVVVAALAMTACVADRDTDPGRAPARLPTGEGPVRAPDPPVLDLLREFSGCIQTPDLAAAGFADTWSQVRSAAGQCAVCHAHPSSGFAPITPDDAIATDQIAGSLAGISVFFTTEGGDVVVNALPFVSTSTRIAPHGEHPSYDFAGAAPEGALDDVYDAAHARFESGTCDPPRF
jgi:hypothetical protein